MTDRELLEMAAKAAGLRIHVWGRKGAENISNMSDERMPRWNPLTDDGDALRLAVKLKLEMDFFPEEVRLQTALIWGSFERLSPGPLAATRRAIVRAAAEIGRTK